MPPKHFYLGDEEAGGITVTKRQQKNQTQLPSVSSTESILKFPIESSHAYSYAHLLPNSLALRLNVLKRSLEIWRDRPHLFRTASVSDTSGVPNELSLKDSRAVSNSNLTTNQNTNSIYVHGNNSGEFKHNALSAALAALFRPPMRRSDSVPIASVSRSFLALSSRDLSTVDTKSKLSRTVTQLSDATDSSELWDVIKLLEDESITSPARSTGASFSQPNTLTPSLPTSLGPNLGRELNSPPTLADPFAPIPDAFSHTNVPFSLDHAIASTLHDLSLSNLHNLKNKILYALASPFIETTAPSTLLESDMARPLHFLGKNSLPQSVFSVETDSPWNLRAANDLACLMFGVSKNTIKSLTLMDLIAPQFRTFVTERLTRTSFTSRNQERNASTNIIFAGEIVAISRPGDNQYSWTSMWAKKRGSLIIIMFDQIPCDAVDVVISSPRENVHYGIESVKKIAGSLLFDEVHTIKQLSESIDADLSRLDANIDNRDLRDSQTINLTRYYTLQVGDNNIPCAVTSNPLELNPDRHEIKLRIHSLPYIAGIFVLRASDLKILSCNNAIARNLFGFGFDELTEKTIDYIIPSFSRILNTGLLAISHDLPVTPGLVLPEHFFRRYDAVLNATSAQNSEELFLSSHGIEGTHRDGKPISVDVQLRVGANKSTYVLWVTYSRQKSQHNLLEKLGELSANVSPNPNLSPNISRALPSQLKLLPDNESELFDLGPELQRKSSTRRPKANTFTIPVERFGTTLAPTSQTTAKKSETAPSSEGPQILYTKYSEEYVLRMENEELAAKKAHSPQWPQKIGAKKRTKKFSEFDILRKMGEGAYGKVVLAQHKEDHEYKIIIKCIDKERILVDTWVRDRSLGTIPSEIQVMAYLNSEPHPNIMRIIDYFEDQKYYYLETPIFGNPPAIDLFDVIEIKKDMTELECQFIFKQVVLAIYHLHKNGIVHRDIKDENVIVDEHGIIKLIDFGSAGYTRLGPFDVFVGTIDYASPEVLKGEKYEGKPQDIWALGILLYTLLYKENPFYNVDAIMEGELNVPYVISDKSLKLIRRILDRDVDKRPTITDIVEDPWLDI